MPPPNKNQNAPLVSESKRRAMATYSITGERVWRTRADTKRSEPFIMSTRSIVSHQSTGEKPSICRFCGELLITVEFNSGDSPGSKDPPSYATLDGNQWCDSAGNLTVEEWRLAARSAATLEQYPSYQSHSPFRDRDSKEYGKALTRLIALAA